VNGWFGIRSTGEDRYRVTGIRKGWFGESKVSETVTGRAAADRLAGQMRRRGDRDVTVTRDGWWAL
jgi:hypothetical protein